MNDEAGYQTLRVHVGMCGELEAMRGRRDALWQEYQALEADCLLMEQAVEMMKRRAGSVPEAPPVTVAAPEPSNGISFDGCENTHSRLVRMAESWGGTVCSRDAADLLIELGIGTGRRTNLVSTLQKEMNGREDLWEYVGPRTYFYRPYRNGVATSGPE